MVQKVKIQFCLVKGEIVMDMVSIIIPIYKVEDYLEKCIQSVILQTYKNIEIILVDDGSPDRCPEICDNYAILDARIKVVHKPNGGLSSARNAGIKCAVGDFICFLDSDDYVDEKYVEKMLDCVKSGDGTVDLVVSNFDYVYSDHIADKNIKYEEKVYSKKEYIELMFTTSNNVRLILSNAKLYRKSLFDDCLYKEGIIHEDEEIIFKIINACRQIKIINDVLYHYVQRDGSIMSSLKLEKEEILLSISLERYQYLLSNGFQKNIINKAHYYYISTILNLFKHAIRANCMEQCDFYKDMYKKNSKKLKSLKLRLRLALKYVLIKIRIFDKIKNIEGR